MGDRAKCSKCESSNVYVLRNGDVICRACGGVTYADPDKKIQDLIEESNKEGEI